MVLKYGLFCLTLMSWYGMTQASHVCDEECESGFPPSCAYGCVLPVNPFAYIGQIATLNCTTRDPSMVNSLYFTMKNDINISLEYQRVISNDTVQLSMPVTKQDSSVHIQCVWGSTPYGSQFLQADYPPRIVKILKPEVFDWKNLTLLFDVGKYFHLNMINITVEWTADGANSWYFCSSGLNSCFINSTEFKNSSNYKFKITVSNKKTGDSVTTNYTMETELKVKPAPVSRDSITITRSSRNVILQWYHRNHYRGLEYRITTYSNGNVVRNQTTTQNHTIVDDLRPYTDYVVTILVRSLKGEYWSEATDVETSTLIDIPDYGANVTGGSFLSESCKYYKRYVYIYVKEPDQMFQNGPLKEYLVRYMSSNGNITAKFDITTTITQELLCRERYVVYLNAVNEAGSSQPSKLIISPLGQIESPHAIMVALNETVEVSWKSDSALRPLRWTVFWCDKGSTTYCSGTLDWIYVDGGKRSAVLPLSEVDVGDGAIFGVSVETEQGSSPLRWHECIYDVDSDPKKLSAPVIESVVSEPNLGLTTRWSLPVCQQRTLISQYNVTYCHVLSGECETRRVPSSRNSDVAKDLTAGANYSVRIQQVSVSGLQGRASETKFAVPVDRRLTSGQIAGVSIGVILAVGLLSIGSYFICGSLRKNWKAKPDVEFPPDIYKMSHSNGAPELPPKPDALCTSDKGHGQTKGRDQNRHDSGHSSPPSTPEGEGEKNVTVPGQSSGPMNAYSQVTFKKDCEGDAERRVEAPEQTVAFVEQVADSHDESVAAAHTGSTIEGFESSFYDTDDDTEEEDTPYIRNEQAESRKNMSSDPDNSGSGHSESEVRAEDANNMSSNPENGGDVLSESGISAADKNNMSSNPENSGDVLNESEIIAEDTKNMSSSTKNGGKFHSESGITKNMSSNPKNCGDVLSESGIRAEDTNNMSSNPENGGKFHSASKDAENMSSNPLDNRDFHNELESEIKFEDATNDGS